MVFRHTMDEYIAWLDKAAPSVAPVSDMSAVFSKAVFMLEKSPRSTYQ